MVANYSLIECPTWSARVEPRRVQKGGPGGLIVTIPGESEIRVVPELPEWPHTHGGVCQSCGRLVDGSLELGCPRMKDPERATLELIRLKAPPEVLHSEA